MACYPHVTEDGRRAIRSRLEQEARAGGTAAGKHYDARGRVLLTSLEDFQQWASALGLAVVA